jgi:hypothetical protein
MKVLSALRVVFALAVSCVTIWGFVEGFMFYRVSVPVWLLIVIAPSFFAICRMARIIVMRADRKFAPGDEVSMIADSRKFIVIRYRTFFPHHAVCKLENGCECMSVNQKYLKPYMPAAPGLNAALARLLTQSAGDNDVIPRATLTRL